MLKTLHPVITNTQREVIRTILYFDVFNYPLTRDELMQNSAAQTTIEQFNEELKTLVDIGLLKQQSGFILSPGAGDDCIGKRQQGNHEAEKMMPMAVQYSRKIASFPFVEAVFLSGGLSKNYYDEKSDIDYFIVTSPSRLWICRTLLILRYKLLPRAKKRFWCTNYFISSDSLVIPDENIFTATELAYLVPTINYKSYSDLLRHNDWYRSHLPNKPLAADTQCAEPQNNGLKKFVESVFSGGFGRWVDNKLLYITLRHWQKKYPELASEDFELQFRSRKNVCKRHTKGFQNRVLKRWQEKLLEFETTFKVSL